MFDTNKIIAFASEENPNILLQKLCKQFKKVKYIGETDEVCLIKDKIYDCLGEEQGHYRVVDEEGYDADEEIQGYLYPKRFFVEVNDD